MSQIISLLLLAACRQSYTPPAVTTDYHYLVVEGLINTGADSTIINLSRTVLISKHSTFNPELLAKVTIQGSDNSSYPLTEAGNGKYVSPGLNLGNSHQYRLSINTADGKSYLSDFLTPKVSPPIDSVGYVVESNGLQLYVNTHDATNSSKYYMWQYNETWKFHSGLDSYFVIQADTFAVRQADQDVYYCFRGDTASTVLLGTSTKLAKDVIYQAPIAFISSSSEKIEDRYTILVTQTVLTPEAYNYYEQLKTNTEKLGSIFDAQPSELPGNIHAVNNPGESVIGYLSAGTTSQKRIFIDSRTLPNWLSVTYYDTLHCLQVVAANQTDFDFDFLHIPPYYIPTTSKFPPLGGTPACVDCRFRGTTAVPPFWIDE